MIKYSLFIVKFTILLASLLRGNESSRVPDTSESKFPYQANLVIANTVNDDEENCSASIIHERWLLTAAHCLLNLRHPRYLNITVGTTHFLGLGGSVYEHETYITHEDWKLGPDNDIALIRLKKRIKFNTKTRPVSLPKNGMIQYENSLAVLTSWGQAGLDVPALELQVKNLTVISRKQCHGQLLTLIKRLGKSNPDDISFFVKAARSLSGLLCTSGTRLHQGDSGGPLVVDGTQIGIASSSYMCTGRPGLFTRVFSFIDWIHFQMNKYNDNPL